MDSNGLSKPDGSHPPNIRVSKTYLETERAMSIDMLRSETRRPTNDLLTPRFILRMLQQCWLVVAPVGLLLSLVVVASIIMFFVPVYRASAVMQISSRTTFIAYKSDEPIDLSKEFIETQIELLHSKIVLESVLEQPEIVVLPEIQRSRKPLEWLTSVVKVRQVGHSELYEVYCDNPDPKNALLLTNSIVDTYFDVRKRDEMMRSERVIELLKEEKQARAKEVQLLREKMRTLSQETIGRDPFTDLPSTGGTRRPHPLHALQEQLTTAEVEVKFLEVEVQAMQEGISKESIEASEIEVYTAVDRSGEITELRGLIATKKALLHRVESTSTMGKNDPTYRRVGQEVQSFERALESALATARPKVVSQLKAIAVLDHKDALHRLQAKLESRRSMEKIYRDRYQAELEEASRSENKSLDLEFTRDELAREEKVFELIAERSMALSTEMRAPGRITLLRHADLPRHPIEKLPLRLLAMAVVACFCVPLGIALAWELSIGRISDTHQLSEHSAFPLVREVTLLPKNANAVSRNCRLSRLFEECIENLRVSLYLSEDNCEHRSHGKVVAVVSAVQGEGKTSIASQLAVSIARYTGQPTLLIDGDMRAPDVHDIFNIPNDNGLAQVLDDSCTVDEALITNWSDYIHLLPAGKLNKSPYSLLGGGRLDKLLSELRPRYANIIIDTPPVLSAAESLLLAAMADQTILCTKRNTSRGYQVRLACARLVSAGMRLAVVVFNAVPSREYSQKYGSYDYRR